MKNKFNLYKVFFALIFITFCLGNVFALRSDNFSTITGNKTSFENGTPNNNPDMNFTNVGSFVEGNSLIGKKSYYQALNAITSNITVPKKYSYVWTKLTSASDGSDFALSVTGAGSGFNGGIAVNVTTGKWNVLTGGPNWGVMSNQYYPPVAGRWYLYKIEYTVGTGNYNAYVYDYNGELAGSHIGVAALNTGTTTGLRISNPNGYLDGLVYSDTDYDSLTFPIGFTNINFDYDINKFEGKIYLYDKSTFISITDWNWVIDGTSISTDQNTSFSATQLTDYNICLFVNSNSESYCKTINSGRFYGITNFNFKDENSGSYVTNVSVNFNGIDYSTGSDHNFTQSVQGITDGDYCYTFNKTGYSTRQYCNALTEFTDTNKTILLLPTANTKEIQFRFYKPDKTTTYSNAYIEIQRTDTNYTLERKKTDSTGLVTFNLDQNSSKLKFDMNNSENIYNSVVLTINRPKDEQTLIDINSNWNYDISGLAAYVDSNVSTNTKIFAIYSNTVNTYSVIIGSNSTTPTYTTRKYDIQVFGNDSNYTLQAYLINTTNSIQTTIYTINPYTNQSVSDVTIKIYRTLPLIGKTLIEQTVTDAKGQSIVYLILNQTYSFEISVGTTLIRTETYVITGTSSTIYFKVDPGYDLSTTPMQTSIYSFWTPGKSSLGKQDSNISANVSYGTNKNSITVSSILINCYNQIDLNNVLLFQDSFNLPAMNFVQTYDFNLFTKELNSVSFDANYPITCNIYTTLNDGNLIVARQTYTMNNDDPQINLGYDLRPFFGCTATNDPNIPCPSMILAAVFITMMAITGIMIESGFTQPEFAGILFLIGLGFFTFFTWIPPILFVVVLIIGMLVYVALGVRRI